MALVQVRRTSVVVDTVHHEGGPPPGHPLRIVAASAAVANPYAGVYEEDLTPFMTELRDLGRGLAREAVEALGGPDQVEAYGKGAIVGSSGELEHGAVWHEAGGLAMRTALREPPAMVPSAKAVGAMGYRLMVPVHYINASYVRSHYNGMEIGMQDAPRPDEVLFALVMADGGRIHARLGGLTKAGVRVHDGQR